MKTIGICGPSCSGKTTLAKKLDQQLRGELISLDYFYKSESKPLYIDYNGEEIRTFERPEQYNGKAMAELVETIENLEKKLVYVHEIFDMDKQKMKKKIFMKRDYLILEGFLLFSYEELIEKIEHKFYLNIPYEKTLERRSARPRNAPADEGYRKIGKSEWEQFGIKQKEVPGIIILDGTKSINELYDEVMQEIGQKSEEKR